MPPTSSFIGKTAGAAAPAQATGISLLAINRDKEVLRADVRGTPIRAGDMLVLHSIWTDLAQAESRRTIVVVTDYRRDEQRPHKFKIAMTIFGIAMLRAWSWFASRCRSP